jgi:hypothetical protein
MAHYPRAKFTLFIALSTFVAGIILGASVTYVSHKETVIVRTGTPNTPAAMSSVNLMIDHGDGTIKTWNTISWHESMSVLNLLETVAGAKGIQLSTKDGEKNGPSVTAIDGLGNGAKGTTTVRWQYWVNNTYEPRIAAKYYLKPGDIVLFKYVTEQPK